MHASAVPPDEERFVIFDRLFHKAHRRCGDFHVNGFHALLGQRTGVFYPAVGVAVNHTAGTELLRERNPFGKLQVSRIVRRLRFFFCVQVVEIAKEFVETVISGQHLVAVAQMILAELTGRIAHVFEHHGNGRVFLFHPLWCARQADFGQAGAYRRLAGDEGSATGGAALLAIPIGEQRTVSGDAVDVGRPVTHHALVVGTDIELADIITPDDKDIGFLCGLLRSEGVTRPQHDAAEGDHRPY